MIELRPFDLKRPPVGIGKALVETKPVTDRPIAGDEVSAVLGKEVAAQQLIGDAEAIEELVVVRKKRLAYLEAGKPCALEQRYGQSLLCEEGRGGASSGASANDDHVAHLAAKRFETNVLFCLGASAFRPTTSDSGSLKAAAPQVR